MYANIFAGITFAYVLVELFRTYKQENVADGETDWQEELDD